MKLSCGLFVASFRVVNWFVVADFNERYRFRDWIEYLIIFSQ